MEDLKSIPVNQPTRSRAKAIVGFLIAGLLWIITVTQHVLGFIPPKGGEAIGFDVVPLLIWSLFLYTGWKLVKTLRGKTS